MNYLSICSGIEAATVAWHPLGWKAFAYSEIEKFPCQVLKHHYPQTPNFGDMTKFKEWPDATLDVLVGGTPCQSFSVAGLRKGLDDPRGNLMLTYLAIADKYRPKWVLWENVPGVLSSNGGRDFGSLLGGLAKLGYGFAYRVLDAQYFGVAQRRRRVFVVGYLGDWRRAAAVLFERDSLSGNPAPSREARQTVAGTITAGAFSGGAGGRPEGASGGHFQPVIAMAHGQGGAEIASERSPTLTCNHEAPIAFVQNSRDEVRLMGGDGAIVGALAAETGAKQQCYIAQPTFAIPGNVIGRQPGNGGNGLGADDSGAMYTLTKTDIHAVAHPMIVHGTQDPCTSDIAFAQGRNNGGENVLVQPSPIGWSEELNALENVQPTIQRGGQGGRHEGVMTTSMQVRRLTPVECERLQGFPDGYTDIPYKNGRYIEPGEWVKPPLYDCPDGPRYKALGNSMAMPVLRWIGERIAAVDAIAAVKAVA